MLQCALMFSDILAKSKSTGSIGAQWQWQLLANLIPQVEFYLQ